MKIALQYAKKRDGSTMALFSKEKRKFRLNALLQFLASFFYGEDNMRIRTTLASATLFARVACGWLIASSSWPVNTIAAQERHDQTVKSDSSFLPQEYPARYMGGDAKLVTAPNGAVIYDEALKAVREVSYIEKTVEKIGDGIWVIGGYSFVNCIVVEAPDGLIIYDTGISGQEGKQFRAVIEEKISKRPIKAIIYSHSHWVLGGKAMVDDPKSVTVIGHPKLNETIKQNMEAGGAPAAIPELGPVAHCPRRGPVQQLPAVEWPGREFDSAH